MFGDAACTSFFPAKPLGCYGDGGAVFTDSDETAAMIRSLCVHGKGSFKYDNVRIGMNSRLDTIQAAILLVKMDALEKYELADVNAAAAMYNEALAGIPAILPVVPEGWYSSWAQYTLRLRSQEERDRVQSELKAQGIPTMVYYPKPMHTQQAFDGLKQYIPCPVTEDLCATVLSLPMHPYLTRETVQTVADALRRALKLRKNEKYPPHSIGMRRTILFKKTLRQEKRSSPALRAASRPRRPAARSRRR